MIEKLKGEGRKKSFVCPLCDSSYKEYDEAQDCLEECALNHYQVEERTTKSDGFRCTECEEEFINLEEANKHPLHCLLVAAAKHPAQTKLKESA